jgi:glutamate-1-semialdehyde 2,1-aminomutase
MNHSEQLFLRAQKVSPGGVHSPVRALKNVNPSPIFFESAEGAILTAADGKTYIDFCQSFGPMILGHRDPEVSKSVQEVFDKAWSLGTCESYSLELAEWICERLPWVEKIRFVCSGTEAVMTVLRLARAATGRSRIVKFEGCYHGHVDSMLVKAGSGLAGESASSSAGVSEIVASETLVAALDDEENLIEIFNRFGVDIAAVIIEPLPANFGLLPQRKAFLQKMAELCRQNGSLLIFDEVISGFRTNLGGMAQETGICPDLVTYGKVLGGGFPVGAYAGRAELLDLMAPVGSVYQAGTLAAQPMAMRAGLITLKKLQEKNIPMILEKRCQTFCNNLRERISLFTDEVGITQKASIFWLHWGGNKTIRRIEHIPKIQAEAFKKLFTACLRQGIYLAPSGFEVNFLSLAHSDEILERALEGISNAFKEMYA